MRDIKHYSVACVIDVKKLIQYIIMTVNCHLPACIVSYDYEFKSALCTPYFYPHLVSSCAIWRHVTSGIHCCPAAAVVREREREEAGRQHCSRNARKWRQRVSVHKHECRRVGSAKEARRIFVIIIMVERNHRNYNHSF